MFLFAVALFALFVAFRIVCTLLFLGSPLIFAAHAYILTKRSADPPSPGPFIDTDLDIAALEMRVSLDDLRVVVAGCYERGDEEGLKRTDKSGGKRFDARKALGRELNEAIESAEQSIREQQSPFFKVLQAQQANKDRYAETVRRWLRPKAATRATLVAVFAFAASLALSFVVDLSDLAYSVIFFDALDVDGSVAAACVIGAFLWIVTYQVTLRRELERSPLLARYDDLSIQLVTARLNDSEPGENDATGQRVDSGAGDETWHDVLNVDADATTEQIKTAYRTAIKQYHPDSVQGRGAKIVELAETETRRLNEAYGRAREARGF